MKSMRKERTKGMGLVGLTVFMFLSTSVFSAEADYPGKPVTVNVGMAPGAFAGISAQIFVDGLQKYLTKPQPFIVNYKTGASAMVAADYFMKQPADGYNLMWMTPENIVAMAQNPEKFSFKKEDFSYIGMFAYSPFILVVQRESPYKTFEEFIDYAKKHPEELSYGSPGIASGVHLSTEILMMRTGIKLNHVPFTGGAPAVTALLGGHVTCYIGSTGTLSAHIKPGGGLRVLVVLDSKRIREVPEAPTCKEKGYDVDRGTFSFLVAKKGTPKPVLDTLVKVFKQTTSDPHVQSASLKAGFEVLGLGPEETEKKFNKEYETAREVLGKLGLLGK